MTNTEQWHPVPGYEGWYEVSNHGSVRSLTRTVTRSDGVQQTRPGRPITGSVEGKTGYRKVWLHQDGRRTLRSVHSLVIEAFVGPRLDPAQVIRHLDGDSSNNHIDNLRYGTRVENGLDAVKHGTAFPSRNTHCKRGHEFTEENTYRDPGRNHRTCRECVREMSRRRHKERKARK